MLLNLLAQIFLQLLILTVVITTVTATSISETHSHVLNRHDIIQDLWKNYDKSMIPPTKDGGPVEVTMDITFMQLLEVDAQRETIKTSLYATFYWYDMRLNITKDHFNLNEDKLNNGGFPLSYELFWTPEIYLTNAADDKKKYQFKPSNVLLYQGGFVAWVPPAIFKSSCSIQVKYFPYDFQKCTLEFESFYDYDDVKFVPSDKWAMDIDCRSFRSNGEWSLLSANVSIDSSGAKTKQIWTMIIKRKPKFYNINLVAPIVLFFVLSIFEFYLPSESGEKMTLSISILLGQVVFLSLIANCTAKTSENVPLIGSFLLFSMSMVTLSVIVNVYICNFHFRSSGTHQLTRKMKSIIIEKLAPILRMRRPGKLPDFDEIENVEETTLDSRQDSASKSMPAYLNSTIDQVSYLCKVTEEQENRGSDVDEWHYVAMILDRLMLWIYTIVSILGSLYYGRLVYYESPGLDEGWKNNLKIPNPENPCIADIAATTDSPLATTPFP